MNIQEYKIALEETKKIFDSIDFVYYLENSRTIDDLRSILEEKFDFTPTTDNPYMQGLLFNVVSDSEFMDYIEERYKGEYKFREYTTYNIEVIKGEKPTVKYDGKEIIASTITLMNDGKEHSIVVTISK